MVTEGSRTATGQPIAEVNYTPGQSPLAGLINSLRAGDPKLRQFVYDLAEEARTKNAAERKPLTGGKEVYLGDGTHANVKKPEGKEAPQPEARQRRDLP
jgi:hypothetical protein